MTKTHEVKLSTQFYEDEASGVKPFTIRFNDRNYEKGDILICKEYSMKNPTWENGYSGREFAAKITYVLGKVPGREIKINPQNAVHIGVQDGFAILGIKTILGYPEKSKEKL